MSDTTKSFMAMQYVDVRPWGEYQVMHEDDNCKVKKIIVSANSKLSYQYHTHRKEQWVVTKGQLTVILNEDEKTLNPGMGITIYPGDKHRAWNKTDAPVEFIEVQTGTYFGEDDIVRIEDDYGRQD